MVSPVHTAVLLGVCLLNFRDTLLLHAPVSSQRTMSGRAGDVFTDTQLDEGFHSIVDKDGTAEERIATEFLKQHNTVSSYNWPNLP